MYELKVYEIESAGGKQWVAEYIDFSGVCGGGETPEEAVKEAQENLEVTIEYYNQKGLPLPKPRAAFDYSGKFVVRVSKKLHKDMAYLADHEGVSLNQLVNDALNRYVGQH